MNEELIRLCDFVPEHSRELGLDLLTAAYDLQELFQSLSDCYYVPRGPLVPETICWLGRVSDPHQSTNRHKIDFSMLTSYFNGWALAAPEGGPTFQCDVAGEFKSVPSAAIYFSRSALIEWIRAANLECPRFISRGHSKGVTSAADEIEVFRGKELVSIQTLTQGLIDVIVAVDRAHRGLLPDASAAAIRLAASRIDLRKKRSNWQGALIDLAVTAGVEDFRTNLKTLKKYVGEVKE